MYSIIPSTRWQEILDMTDEKEQGIAATKYVYQLEQEIERLKIEKNNIKDFTETNVVTSIMRKEPFKSWLEAHDRNQYTYEQVERWTGVK